MTLLEELKFNLRESECSYFTDVELQHLLDRNLEDIDKASYEGLVIKSFDDSIALPGGLKTESNRDYWLGLAKRFKRNLSGAIPRGDEFERKV